MNIDSEILVCPKCHGDLSDNTVEYICNTCESGYPVYKGIPDFRNVNLEFKATQQELKIREALLKVYESSTFDELIDIRFRLSEGCTDDLCKQQKTFELSYEQKGNFRAFQINKMIDNNGPFLGNSDCFLDIGCGSGTATHWIMKGFKRGVGLDYSLVDLIVGKKFLEENSIDNLMLVCADARKLPFSKGGFDFVNATDVIEHILPGQDKFLIEVKRVLRNNGGLYFNSPNRYNLFTPESHVKVRFVGFMPRAWMNAYVKMRKGVSYETIRLLSLREVHSLLLNSFGGNYVLEGPFMDFNAPATDFKRKVIKKLPYLLTFLNRMFLSFTTNYHVLVFKT